MREKILKYCLIGLTLIFGFFSWFSVQQALSASGINAWLIPIAIFSAYAILLCLIAILVRSEITAEFTGIISILSVFIFVQAKWHIFIVAIGILLMLSAMRNIRKDLDLNIKVNLWKSLYTGKFKMVLALALLISSQYFFMISNTNGQKSIPRFDLSGVTSKLVGPILGMINPNFKTIQQEGLTVDQFIIKSQEENAGGILSENNLSINSAAIDAQIPENLPSAQREALKQEALRQIADSQSQLLQKNKELMLQEGRQQLSQMVGRDISGNEKIADVFAGLIDKKINDYFQFGINGDPGSSLFSYILAAILFLTVWPLGSILSIVWFAFVIIIFKLFIHFGLIEIRTVTAQREMIV